MSDAGIVTPEGVVLDFEPAGITARLAARVVDLSVQAAVLAVSTNLLIAVAAAGGGETLAIVLVLVLVFSVLFLYPLLLEAFAQGRTLGKMALGLRVVTVEGAPARVRHAAIRSMMQIVDLLLTAGGAAVASALLTRRSQRLGDVLAGTTVIRERRTASTLAERAVRFRTPHGLDQLVASLDAASLDARQAAIVRSFLIRVGELDPASRLALASRLADLVAERLGQPRPPDLHPETWLACVAAAQQQRHDQGGTGPGSRSSLPPPPGRGGRPAS